MPNLLRWIALLTTGCGLALAATSPTIVREYELKAAALYNIIAFTDWPAEAFDAPDAPLVVGVFGQGPIASLLTQVIAEETWRGRPIKLRQLATPAAAAGCHVIFVGRSEHSRWRTLRPVLSGPQVLTVSDAENFARQGGIVQLAIERNKLRLIINLSAARARGLTISSKVLRLADVIEDSMP